MTKNQIEYQNSLENRRSNLAKENLQLQAQQETGRHNLVTEAAEQQKIQNQQAANAEQARHNQATESLGLQTLDANIDLGYSQLAESQRSNLARELENNRTNTANEALKELATTTQANTAKRQIAANLAITRIKEQGLNARAEAQNRTALTTTGINAITNLAKSIVQPLVGGMFK